MLGVSKGKRHSGRFSAILIFTNTYFFSSPLPMKVIWPGDPTPRRVLKSTRKSSVCPSSMLFCRGQCSYSDLKKTHAKFWNIWGEISQARRIRSNEMTSTSPHFDACSGLIPKIKKTMSGRFCLFGLSSLSFILDGPSRVFGRENG